MNEETTLTQEQENEHYIENGSVTSKLYWIASWMETTLLEIPGLFEDHYSKLLERNTIKEEIKKRFSETVDELFEFDKEEEEEGDE
jgi:hypothetical protein